MGSQQGLSGVKETLHVDQPRMYDVLMLNDDFTTMDFVVMVLKDVFFHSSAEAEKIMMDIHRSGQGIAGTYTLDIAQSKVRKTQRMARDAGFPLRLRIKQR